MATATLQHASSSLPVSNKPNKPSGTSADSRLNDNPQEGVVVRTGDWIARWRTQPIRFKNWNVRTSASMPAVHESSHAIMTLLLDGSLLDSVDVKKRKSEKWKGPKGEESFSYGATWFTRYEPHEAETKEQYFQKSAFIAAAPIVTAHVLGYEDISTAADWNHIAYAKGQIIPPDGTPDCEFKAWDKTLSTLTQALIMLPGVPDAILKTSEQLQARTQLTAHRVRRILREMAGNPALPAEVQELIGPPVLT
jgi:hypothetical protein